MIKKFRKGKNERRQRVERFFKDYSQILNITGFERELKLPKGSVQKFLSEDRNIKDNRISIIDDYILGMLIDYENIKTPNNE